MHIYLETNKCLILTSAKFHFVCCTETVFLERVLLLYGHTSFLYKSDSHRVNSSTYHKGAKSLCLYILTTIWFEVDFLEHILFPDYKIYAIHDMPLN